MVSVQQKDELIEKFMVHLDVGPNIITYLS